MGKKRGERGEKEPNETEWRREEITDLAFLDYSLGFKIFRVYQVTQVRLLWKLLP